MLDPRSNWEAWGGEQGRQTCATHRAEGRSSDRMVRFREQVRPRHDI